MPSKSSVPTQPPEEVDDLIIKVLDRSPEGVNADKIRRALPLSHRLPRAALAHRLECLVEQGKLQRTAIRSPRAKRPTVVYSREPLGVSVANAVLKLLAAGPQALAELRQRFVSHLRPLVEQVVAGLRAEGRVYEHPPLQRRRRLALTPPDPLTYLGADLRKLFLKARRFGFSHSDILKAVKRLASVEPSNHEEAILQAMIKLKVSAAEGALVYIPDLRAALRTRFPEKAAFDQAILRLARQEKVQLQSHSLPAELTEEERAAMIDNGRGSYFMAIGIRRE